MSFATSIRRAREKRGVSQTELAQRSGLKPSAISHFETGRRSPSAENLLKLARALRCSVDEILGISPPSWPTGKEAALIAESIRKMDLRDLDTFARLADLIASRPTTMIGTVPV